jgi:NADH:ubiquinone oxidoreductase subunit E
MMINGETYGSLTPAKVRDILMQKRKEAEADA